MIAQGGELHRLLKLSIGQVNAALTGRPRAHERLRSLVGSVRDAMVRGCADPETLAAEYRGELAELDLLCAWPEDEDELEFAIRFDGLGKALLRALTPADDRTTPPES